MTLMWELLSNTSQRTSNALTVTAYYVNTCTPEACQLQIKAVGLFPT